MSAVTLNVLHHAREQAQRPNTADGDDYLDVLRKAPRAIAVLHLLGVALDMLRHAVRVAIHGPTDVR